MKKVYYLKEDSTPITEDYELIQWFYIAKGHWYMSQALRDLFNYEFNQN